MSARCHAMFPLCGCAPPEKPARAPRVTKVHSEDSHASSHAAPPAAGSAFAGSSDSLPANQAEALTAPSAPDHETVDLGDMPPDDEEGSEHKVVYFIANEAITKVKIGKTKSIKTRLKNSQTFSPEPLHLLCTVPGYTAVETWFHRRFAEHHLHLEWFRLDGELARCISRIKGGLSTDEICPEALHRDGGPAPAAPEDEWAHLSDDDLELQEEIEMLAARLRRADAEAGRRSLAEFTRQCFVNAYKPDEPLQWGPHLDAVCLHVEMQLRDRARARSDWRFTMRAQNLIINVPPRSLKTFILACAQVWCWLHWPSTIILYCSANPIVVTDSSRVFDSIIRSPWFQTTYEPAWSLMPGHDALTDCGNTMKGERKAKGLDSKVTGAGCDWLIVDDPHDMKDNAGAIATTVANYDAAQANRLNNPRTSIRTFIAQRANDPNDLCGHLIDQMVGGGNKVLHLRLPMEYELAVDCKCGTCDHKQPNAFGWTEWRKSEREPLLPERFTPEFLAGELIRLNSLGYAAQMQQRPQPKGGGKIKPHYFRFYRFAGDEGLALAGGTAPRPEGTIGTRTWHADNPNAIVPETYVIGKKRFGMNLVWDLDWLLLTLDAANKKTERGSQWGLSGIGGKGPHVFILDDRTRRGDLNKDIIPQIVELIIKWRPRELLVEDKAAGPSTISTLRAMMEAGKIVDPETGKPIIVTLTECSPGSEDKDLRMDAVLGVIESGFVYLPEGAPWVAAWLAELVRWPATPNDRGDALSQALNHKRPTGSYGDMLKAIAARSKQAAAQAEQQVRQAMAQARAGANQAFLGATGMPGKPPPGSGIQMP